MLIAGLTGSIATGKSTVSTIMKDLGAFIVDADRAAREVVLPGMPAWERIV
ncbi:MAG: dephospho-CoA kinase, partial [Deltaproteobacteria bacterium]|nr:dephospho-CoA kinase [Deltaproteobacteria bacterium]